MRNETVATFSHWIPRTSKLSSDVDKPGQDWEIILPQKLVCPCTEWLGSLLTSLKRIDIDQVLVLEPSNQVAKQELAKIKALLELEQKVS
jgi:hypothetical protein